MIQGVDFIVQSVSIKNPVVVEGVSRRMDIPFTGNALLRYVVKVEISCTVVSARRFPVSCYSSILVTQSMVIILMVQGLSSVRNGMRNQMG